MGGEMKRWDLISHASHDAHFIGGLERVVPTRAGQLAVCVKGRRDRAASSVREEEAWKHGSTVIGEPVRWAFSHCHLAAIFLDGSGLWKKNNSRGIHGPTCVK